MSRGQERSPSPHFVATHDNIEFSVFVGLVGENQAIYLFYFAAAVAVGVHVAFANTHNITCGNARITLMWRFPHTIHPSTYLLDRTIRARGIDWIPLLIHSAF